MNEKILVKGIKHFIEHKKERIANLVDPNREWNDKSEEFLAKVARMVAQGFNSDVQYFEQILKLAEKKSNDRKRKAKPLRH
jgi:hypothetical protein